MKGCIASIDLFQKEKTMAKLQKKSALLSQELACFTLLEHVGEVRQRGFMVGIELVKDKRTKEPYAPEDRIGVRVILDCRKQGLIIRPLGNVIALMPPLSISSAELNKMVRIVYSSINTVTSGKVESAPAGAGGCQGAG